MSIPAITWVKGVVETGTDQSNYKYRNHNYAECGECKTQLMVGNNYYANSTLSGSSVNYSINDKLIRVDDIAVGCGGKPGVGCGLNYKVCPIIGGIQPQVQWNDTTEEANIHPGGKSSVACLYPLSTFNDLQAVLDFKSFFGTGPQDPGSTKSPYNQQILPQFCVTQSTDCPENPATRAPMQTCSRFASVEANNPCPQWLLDTAAEDKINGTANADKALYQYCGYYNSPDCLCINRASSPIYQIMSYGQTAGTDACWWTPCKATPDSPGTYLVPSNLPPCIANNVQVCNNVNVAVGGSSTNLTFNPSAYTSCNLTENTNGKGKSSGGNESVFKTYWWIFLIAVIAIIVVIILMFII